MKKWEIVLAGAIVPVLYGEDGEDVTAQDVREMIVRRKGDLGAGVFVRPEAVLAVVQVTAGGQGNTIPKEGSHG